MLWVVPLVHQTDRHFVLVQCEDKETAREIGLVAASYYTKRYICEEPRPLNLSFRTHGVRYDFVHGPTNIDQVPKEGFQIPDRSPE